MIAPQELRLGNWVTIENPKAWLKLKDIPLQIIGISTNMDRLDKELFPNSEAEIILNGNVPYSQFSEFVKPIELTEEWLLKFGFEKHDDGSVSSQYSYGFNPVTHDYLVYLIWIKDPINGDLPKYPFYLNGHFEMKTVHQLQNLFQSLTGEELTIKEKK